MSTGDLRFGILGPLAAERAGEPFEVGTYRQKSVLALLLIHANQVVSTDRILDELWGEEGRGRQNALWVHISHLRSTLEPGRSNRSQGSVLLTRSPGYLLSADPDSVDAIVFENLVNEGRGLLGHDASAASLIFAEALALWRGRALEEFTYESFAQDEIRRLDSLRLDAVEGRIDADLARGLSQELIGELEGLVRENPLREHLTAQLMTAMYRSRRRAEALRAYDALQNRLRTELGVDPTQGMQDLLVQILDGDPRLEPTVRSASNRPEPGLAIRGYELRAQLGTTDYGWVYLGYQQAVGREVAIKVVRPELANDPSFVRRFEAQAGLISALESNSILPLYDYWREPGGAFLVEKLANGRDLGQVLSEEEVSVERALALIRRIAAPLRQAHELGVSHGNVLLEKVLLDGDSVYLTDFGIGAGRDGDRLADIAGLARCSAQLLAGRHRPLEDLRELLPTSVTPVIEAAIAGKFRSVDALIASLEEAVGDVAPLPDTFLEINNPYKGLQPFQEADAAVFFGRGRLVERMIARLGGGGSMSRFLAVVGPSGSGKSSVVIAGLLPALRREAIPGSSSWFITAMTPGGRPFEHLARALTAIGTKVPPTLLERLQVGPSGLRESVEEILPDEASPLVLVVDQFEEIYTMAPENEREPFIEALVDAITNDRSRLRIVITFRADFYDHPLASRQLGELLREHTELVTPMGLAELEQTIEGPARMMGVEVQPALVAALAADAMAAPGGLPMLQFTLTELFQQRMGMTMTVDIYHQIGGLGGAVARRAEALFADLTPQTQSVARHVFLRLISINEIGSDTRRRALLSELEDIGAGEGIDEMLRAFGRHRLLTFDRDAASRVPTVEIAHESLIIAWKRLRDWIDLAEDDIRAERRLAAATDQWTLEGRNPDFLLGGASLGRYEGWMSDPPLRLTRHEHEFLESAFQYRSQQELAARERALDEAKLRRRTRALAGSAVGIILVIIFAIVAVAERQQASDLADAAAASDRARQLVTESGLVVQDDPELAILLAIEAMRTTESTGGALPEAVDALHWAIQESVIEYPADDSGIPVAVRPHESGPRGVFVMPPAELAALGQQAVGRSFSSSECDEYFPSTACPNATQPISASLTIAGGVDRYAGEAGDGAALQGTRVVLTSAWNGEMVTAAEADITALGAEAGIEVSYRTHRFDEGLEEVAFSDDPGDIISLGGPGLVKDTAVQRPVVDLGAYLGESYLLDAYGEHLIELVRFDDAILGLPISLDPKSLIWYNPDAFAGAGYTVPISWEELISLSDRMVADGNVPWCLGIFAFDATGWPATDWLENFVLQTEGPEFYDQWATHQIPFDHPGVVAALEKVGQMAHTPGYVLPKLIEETGWDEAINLGTQEDPQCWMIPAPSFAQSRSAGAPMAVMHFPAVNAEYRDAVEGGISWGFAVSDRPEVRVVMRSLASSTWGTGMAQIPEGSWFLPAHRDFDVGLFTNSINRTFADLLLTANSSDQFRFDASDMMPPEIGFGPFLTAMTDYLADPSMSAEEALAVVEGAWLVYEAGQDD